MGFSKILSMLLTIVMVCMCMPMIAFAADNSCVSFDESSGTLTLSGTVVASQVKKYSKDTRVRYVVAEDGTIFPRDCQYLFSNFYAESFILHGVDTSKVENMFCMFRNCENMIKININNWNTSNVTSVHSMFYNCSSLQVIDLGALDTSKVTDMSYMFAGCESLTLWFYQG